MLNISNLTGITSDYLDSFATSKALKAPEDNSFNSILTSMLGVVNETNTLANKAEEAEIQFALGESTNTHDLLIAESKAEVALQYTVAVRDKIIEAYKELMQMQI